MLRATDDRHVVAFSNVSPGILNAMEHKYCNQGFYSRQQQDEVFDLGSLSSLIPNEMLWEDK